jgi:MFS family permease
MSASTLAAPQAPAPLPWRAEARTIGLVGVAHGTSHFFHLLLPPLFPALIAEFGLSYSALGLLVTVFFIVSGVGQAVAGFVVDRIGARPVLYAALACFVAAALLAASAQGWATLMLAAALAGLGNSPFHPVDFTILNRRVSRPRLGHAFSVHGISGSLGWAAAPVVMIGVSALAGSWRWALVAAAAGALAVLLLMWWQREALDDRPQRAVAAPTAPAVAAGAGASAGEHPLAFLRLATVWLCFAFFFWSTAALAAIQSFAAPALNKMYGLPIEATAFVVTGYMLFSAAGMALGGFLVARVARLDAVIAAALALAALLMLLVASGWLPGVIAALLAALAGLATGLAGPSRDMLIRQVAPAGATGRVYGTVYCGLDVGFAVAAPVFGWLLDRGQAPGIFVGAAFALALAVLSAGWVGLRLPRSAAARATA